MDDPPDTKRVSRRDLATPPSSRTASSSPPPPAALTARLEAWYGNASPPPAAGAGAPHGPSEPEPVSETYSFRLFAHPRTADAPRSPPRIRLASPALGSAEPGFLPPKARPAAYYFTSPATPEIWARLEVAAVDGREVRRRSAAPWPGCALPWRVTALPASADGVTGATKSAAAVAPTGGSDPVWKRRRPGKKRRIVLRTRLRREAEARAKVVERQKERQKASRAASAGERPGPGEKGQQAAAKRARKNQARKERRKVIKATQKAGSAEPNG